MFTDQDITAAGQQFQQAAFLFLPLLVRILPPGPAVALALSLALVVALDVLRHRGCFAGQRRSYPLAQP